jgi:hypothetical protein
VSVGEDSGEAAGWGGGEGGGGGEFSSVGRGRRARFVAIFASLSWSSLQSGETNKSRGDGPSLHIRPNFTPTELTNELIQWFNSE